MNPRITRATQLLQYRLGPESRVLLDLPTPASSFAAHTATNQRWYNNTMRAFQRLNALLDPFPHERYTAKTYAQVQEILDDHDEIREAKYKARLQKFNELFLRMTFNIQPRDVRRAQARLDVSFDQTYIAPPTPKGYAEKYLPSRIAKEQQAEHLGKRHPGPVDVFAAFHAKTADRGDYQRGEKDVIAPDARKKNNTEYSWGWVANIMMRVEANHRGKKEFPSLIVAWNLSVPNREVSEEAVELLRSAASLGVKPGIADSDKQYWANARPERLLRPALETGFTPSTDYRVDRLGIKGGQHGAVFVEGHAYCPSTPKHLTNATIDNNAGYIDRGTYKLRLEERSAYRLHIKERKPNGKTMLRCPALGPSPTVTCPLRGLLDTLKPNAAAKKPVADKDRPYVEDAAHIDEDYADTICRKHSASFDLTEMQSPEQAFDYGSDEWDTFHDHARNSIESVNQQLKAAGDADIATAARRRVRGFSAASIMLTMLIVNHNIRRITAYLSDKVKNLNRTGSTQPALQRRRDRVWENPYTKTTGNGDLTIPRRVASPNPDAPPGTPQRT